MKEKHELRFKIALLLFVCLDFFICFVGVFWGVGEVFVVFFSFSFLFGNKAYFWTEIVSSSH